MDEWRRQQRQRGQGGSGTHLDKGNSSNRYMAKGFYFRVEIKRDPHSLAFLFSGLI
jgi:hypothetical protein